MSQNHPASQKKEILRLSTQRQEAFQRTCFLSSNQVFFLCVSLFPPSLDLSFCVSDTQPFLNTPHEKEILSRVVDPQKQARRQDIFDNYIHPFLERSRFYCRRYN